MKKIFTSLTLCLAFLSTTSLLAQVPIFTDAYATDVTFASFGDAVNALSVDNTVFQSGISSLKIVVPATGYTGGALVAATPQNLSTYNAVSFWIKGSAAKKLNVAGLGNNAATTVYQTELAEIPVTTTWTKFIIPIPVPAKLTAETGLFHFAEGSDEGAYTIWLDNIQYENLAATVIGTPTATMATETLTKGPGDAFTASGLTCTFPINAVATKLTNTGKAYFTFTSSNTAVATVNALGVGACVSVGTSAITAKLGAVAATGTLTVNVIAGTVPTVAAPTPTRLAANVISLFSKPYTNLTGTDWFPNWGQTTVVSDVLIAGDSTKKYVSFNYQGVQFAKPIDVTTMGFLHIDLWTPNMTSFKVSLINIPPTVTTTVEQAVTLTPTLSGWNSFDIPLSSFDKILKTGIGQFKLEGVPVGSSTAFLDNIYFYKTATGTNDVTFAKNLFTTGPSVSDASLTLFLTENVKSAAQVTLTNISGQVVYSQTATANSTHLINTKNLPAGMYIVGVRVGSTIQSEKIVVGR
jgi:Secretion system C-terminal sorting domain